MNKIKEELELWAILGPDGKYFIGSSDWSEDINKAKIYQNKGAARGIVTMYTDKSNPENHPHLVRIYAKYVEIHKEDERVQKAVKGIAEKERIRALRWKNRRKAILEKRVFDAENELNSMPK